MAVHDNTYKIYELCGLPGLTIEGYTGFAGETGSNIFLGSKTGGSGFNIAAAVSFIGITTFIISAAGVKIGNIFGTKYKSKAELAGGIILILLGLKILLEHLGIL